jgi:hypothetical protein
LTHNEEKQSTVNNQLATVFKEFNMDGHLLTTMIEKSFQSLLVLVAG